jgi:predicted helicase
MQQPGRSRLIARLAGQAREIKPDLLAQSGRLLKETARCLASDLSREVLPEEAADTLAQAIVCAAAILGDSRKSHNSAAANWLHDQLKPWERFALERAQLLSTGASVPGTECHAAAGDPIRFPASYHHLFEHFLHAYARDSRKRRGVFFTPQPVADYIVAVADSLLCEKCNSPAGLADPSVRIIDPACGTGVFLLAVIDYLENAARPNTQTERWSQCIHDLLPRLIGVEILPAAAFLARLNIALKLAETNYDFRDSAPINILTSDALSPLTQSTIRNSPSAIPVLLGNPPFSSLSTSGNDWITDLVRGDDQIRGYVKAGGQRLGERKTWLHDDYVKFIRLAQWHVEQAGSGVVGFVTNHGYLDNATFRLMRQELARVFPHIEILDLHGNRKKHEIAPDGSRDENIFGLDQGIAISLLCRPPPETRSVSEGEMSSTITYSELWGTRAGKLKELQSAVESHNNDKLLRGSPSLARRVSISPEAPDRRFLPAGASSRPVPEYDAGWSLADAMPVNTTAPVTARDHFVVAFTENELRQRMEEFRDLSIPDDEIRRRYFLRTRSARYQQGDTRGWQLSQARRIVAADADWQSRIVRCLYRPFDWRYVFWHPAMIDWPRADVTRHLLGSKFTVQDSTFGASTLNLEPGTSNLSLIARRQQLPTQPCTFFWVADGLALDGVIRSDNRGSESLFPLYVADQAGTGMCANFAPGFIDCVIRAVGLDWLPLGRGDLLTNFGPEDLAAYVYALFHTPGYREDYAERLRTDFPRVIVPRSPESLATMSRLGRELIELHLLRRAELDGSAWKADPLPPDVVNFRAGGYVALRKWLQPKHRSPSDPRYGQIAAAIARTIAIVKQL